MPFVTIKWLVNFIVLDQGAGLGEEAKEMILPEFLV